MDNDEIIEILNIILENVDCYTPEENIEHILTTFSMVGSK